MSDLLRGKVIIVTGGAGLIGREFVKAVIANQGIAIIADCDQEASSRFMTGLKQDNPEATVDWINLDITSTELLQKMITEVSAKYGKIDALVNNAYPRNPNFGRQFEAVTYADFCENIQLHLGGYFLAAQQMALFFTKQGFGNIINIASIYGVATPRFEIYQGTNMTMPVEYAVIKSGIIHLTKYLAQYLKGRQIRVNSISPGGIRDQQPESFQTRYDAYGNTKGMLDPADLSGTLLYLLSDLSQTVTGQNLIVDDGWTL
jgi:NAD(P)-dependent dehydrogenase (short-subunit alcohol dehydrogenase family)